MERDCQEQIVYCGSIFISYSVDSFKFTAQWYFSFLFWKESVALFVWSWCFFPQFNPQTLHWQMIQHQKTVSNTKSFSYQESYKGKRDFLQSVLLISPLFIQDNTFSMFQYKPFNKYKIQPQFSGKNCS